MHVGSLRVIWECQIQDKYVRGVMKASGGDNWSSCNNMMRESLKVSEEGSSFVWHPLLCFPSNLAVRVRLTKVKVCSAHDCLTYNGKTHTLGYLFSSLDYLEQFGQLILKVVLFLDFFWDSISYLPVMKGRKGHGPQMRVILMIHIRSVAFPFSYI